MRKKFTNMLILNQSSIDMVTTVLILIAKTLKVSIENLMVSSSYNLMALILERYMGIVYPLRHHTSFSKINVLLLATAAWLSRPILMLCNTSFRLLCLLRATAGCLYIYETKFIRKPQTSVTRQWCRTRAPDATF